jgi:hypothetical protein
LELYYGEIYWLCIQLIIITVHQPDLFR